MNTFEYGLLLITGFDPLMRSANLVLSSMKNPHDTGPEYALK